MKVRVGFVTNSSSTSYCIVGISDGNLVKEITDAIESIGPTLYSDKMKSWWDVYEFAGHMGLQVASSEYGNTLVGLNAEEALQDQSIAQAADKLIELLRHTLGVSVATNDIRLLFGSHYDG